MDSFTFFGAGFLHGLEPTFGSQKKVPVPDGRL